MIGQFICDNSGQNAVDDGTIATLEANFRTAIQNVGRVRLTSSLNFYVNPNGSDSNTGLNAGTPLQTIQRAYDLIRLNYDLNGQTAQINLANGTYSSGLFAAFPLVGQNGAVGVIGNLSSPASVIVNSSTQQVNTFMCVEGASIDIRGLTVNSSGSGQGGYCLVAQSSGYLNFANLIFGNANTGHIIANIGGIVNCIGSYSINGNAPSHIITSWGTVNYNGGNVTIVVTLNGTPNFTTAFITAFGSSFSDYTNISFSGSATGQRYIATQGGCIVTNGGGANFFPGSIAGNSNFGFYS